MPYQSNSGQWPPPPPPPPPVYPRRGNKQQVPGIVAGDNPFAAMIANAMAGGPSIPPTPIVPHNGGPIFRMPPPPAAPPQDATAQQQPIPQTAVTPQATPPPSAFTSNALQPGGGITQNSFADDPNNGGGDGGNNGGGTDPGNGGTGPGGGGTDTGGGSQTPPNTMPQGWNPGDWATANQWLTDATAQGYGNNYKWLLTTPNAIRDYHMDAERLSALGITNINFTDWARMKGYDSPIDRNSFDIPAGMAQRGGTNDQYQTMVRWLADGAEKYGVDAMQPYAKILSATPGFITSYMMDMNRAAAAGFTGIHFVDWLKYQNGAPSPLAGKISPESADAMAKWWALDHGGAGNIPPNDPVYGNGGGSGGGGTNPNPPPPTPPPPTGPPVPPPPTPPVLPPGPIPPVVPPPVNNGDPTLGNFDEILRKQISDFEQRTNPQFQQQRDDIQRRTTQAASLNGSLNSGGFGEILNTALSKQYAQEQATTAPEITKLTMAAQANALQKFSIDMNAILQREQISTNADLERSSQALQRYGIDHNDLLERYKAELGLKGIQYSADRQVDAASLQAAAAHAAANAQADASRYATDARYNTDLFQGDISREKNIMDYILGISSLGPEWAKLILGSDPFGRLTGNPPPGDTTVIH